MYWDYLRIVMKFFADSSGSKTKTTVQEKFLKRFSFNCEKFKEITVTYEGLKE